MTHPPCGVRFVDPSRPKPKRLADTVVDVHAHVASPEVERLVASHPRKQSEPGFLLSSMGAASAARTAAMLEEIRPCLTQVSERIAAMDALHVDVQLLSPSPGQYYHFADRELAARIVTVQNEGIAELCAKTPARFQGLGQVALQHPDLAAEQLETAITRLGLLGVEISSAVEGMELDDARLEPFWAAADRLEALVFLHPLGTTLGARLAQHYLVNVIGQPLETTIALSRLIFSGVLDRYPRVRIIAAHGGGYLPTYPSRHEHALRVRPDARGAKSNVRDYLATMWFDSVLYDSLALRHLVERVGVERVLLGTDFPFDMGSYDFDLLFSDSGLNAEARARVLGENALQLMRKASWQS